MSSQVTAIPRGFRHMNPINKNKFAGKYPTRIGAKPKAFVPVHDRIKNWNIVPGDSVRLMVGKKREKFIDEELGAKSGYKVYKVSSIDQTRNRVYLEGLNNKKSNAIREIPDNLHELDENEQRSYTGQKNFVAVRRAVQYSNVQLCVEDNNGPDSVFASRVATSSPRFIKDLGQWRWKRFAANLSGETDLPIVKSRGQVLIPWPVTERKPTPAASASDTLPKDVLQASLKLSQIETIPHEVIPATHRSPAPTDQRYADEYIFKPTSRAHHQLQTAMPMYLSEELSPRFARSKKQATWQARREQEEKIRLEVSRSKVAEWEAAGRDSALNEPIPGVSAGTTVINNDMVRLDGVEIRSRTRQEVREGVLHNFNHEVLFAKKQVAKAYADGMKFDAEGTKFTPQEGLTEDEARWLEGPKGERLAFKRRRKDRKERKMLEKLERLTLTDDKNQVVPEELRRQ